MELAKETMNLDPARERAAVALELKPPLIKRLIKGRGFTPRFRWFMIGLLLGIALLLGTLYLGFVVEDALTGSIKHMEPKIPSNQVIF